VSAIPLQRPTNLSEEVLVDDDAGP
jgi:hypothetical protein